jgi:hypothetical protein
MGRNRSPKIMAKMFDIPIEPLIDTGAALTIINESFALKSKIKLMRWQEKTLRTIDGSITTPKYYAPDVCFEIVGVKYICDCIVLKGVKPDIIFGTDIISTAKMVIDLSNDKIESQRSSQESRPQKSILKNNGNKVVKPDLNSITEENNSGIRQSSTSHAYHIDSPSGTENCQTVDNSNQENISRSINQNKIDIRTETLRLNQLVFSDLNKTNHPIEKNKSYRKQWKKSVGEMESISSKKIGNPDLKPTQRSDDSEMKSLGSTDISQSILSMNPMSTVHTLVQEVKSNRKPDLNIQTSDSYLDNSDEIIILNASIEILRKQLNERLQPENRFQTKIQKRVGDNDPFYEQIINSKAFYNNSDADHFSRPSFQKEKREVNPILKVKIGTLMSEDPTSEYNSKNNSKTDLKDLRLINVKEHRKRRKRKKPQNVQMVERSDPVINHN